MFAFKVARPDVESPNHKILAGPNLERCYEKVQIASEKALQLSNWIGCIITDACSNTNNEYIVNYMIVADQYPSFFNQSLQKNKAIQPHQVGVDWGDTDDDEDLNEDKWIVDENGSLMEVDDLDTPALDR